MIEHNTYQDVLLFSKGAKVAYADVHTHQEKGSPNFQFEFKVTKGQLRIEQGIMYIRDMLRHYDVLSDGIGFSRS